MSDKIEAVRKLAVEAAGANACLYSPPAGTEPPGVYYKRDADGVLHRVESAVKRRLHAGHLDAVLQAVTQYDARATTEVWVHVGSDEAQVVGLCHETPTVIHTITLPLQLSAPFLKLAEIAKLSAGGLYKQDDLYLLLKTTLSGCFPQVEKFVEAIGCVDFHKRAEASGTINRGGTSMSKAHVATAGNTNNMPEYPIFDVPVFKAGFRFTAAVRCFLELNANEEKFRLVVLPGQIDDAVTDAAAAVASAVRRGLSDIMAAEPDRDADQESPPRAWPDVLVFQGKPN